MKPLPMRRQTLISLAAAAASPLVWPVMANAQAWPARGLRLVVPFPPGGATDLSARFLAEHLSRRLGQPVVVENKPGGATVIGVDAVAKAPADGHTLLVAGGGSYSVLPAMRSDLPFDIARDFAPISLISTTPLVLLTPADRPFRRLADFIAAAKAKPDTLRYATYGPGSSPHLSGEMLAHAAGIRIDAIPYKGTSEVQLALLRGEVDLGFETYAASAAHIKAEKLRPLALNSEKRSALVPDLPSFGELGLAEAAVDVFYGIAAPAGTPAPVLSRLSREVGEILSLPEVREKMAGMFLDIPALGPQAMVAKVNADMHKYRDTARRMKIAP